MNTKHSKLIWLYIAVFVHLLTVSSLSADEITFDTIQLSIAGGIFDIEVANTPRKRQQGLMFRNSLAETAGMIFVYQAPGDNKIWMKNTLIPLTVIWLSHDARIIDIKKLFPCRQPECPIYSVDEPSKYIIELHAGFNSLKPGDYIPAVLSLQSHQ